VGGIGTGSKSTDLRGLPFMAVCRPVGERAYARHACSALLVPGSSGLQVQMLRGVGAANCQRQGAVHTQSGWHQFLLA